MNSKCDRKLAKKKFSRLDKKLSILSEKIVHDKENSSKKDWLKSFYRLQKLEAFYQTIDNKSLILSCDDNDQYFVTFHDFLNEINSHLKMFY
jgi:hypothetical protein